MQPYQTGAEENIRQASLPFKIAGQGMKAAYALLSPYLKANLAAKGLSRINPKIGSFIKKAVAAGFTEEEVIENIRKKAEEKKAKEGRNIIEQYSPELFNFMKDLIGKGQTPLAAGALAQLPGNNFSETIKKIVKDHKTNWSNIIESVFGNGKTAQSQGPAPQESTMQQSQGQMSSPLGQGQQALMEILRKIQEARGSQ